MKIQSSKFKVQNLVIIQLTTSSKATMPIINHKSSIINHRHGFTLLETLLVIGIFLFMTAILVPNSLNLRSTSTINTSVLTLVTDLKNQQIKAMTGDTEGRGLPDTYSIYIQPASYVLFHGQNYSAGDLTNFAIPLDTSFQYSTTFPNSKIVFASGSGQINNYVATQSSVTIRETRTGKQKVIQINKYGVITAIN